jgi:hypothetical protein
LDPDAETLWIRIRIGNPDPDPGARKLRNFSGKKALFGSVSDPHRFYADPDPDPAFLLNADPDPDPTCRI